MPFLFQFCEFTILMNLIQKTGLKCKSFPFVGVFSISNMASLLSLISVITRVGDGLLGCSNCMNNC